jgi:hypothetical protein
LTGSRQVSPLAIQAYKLLEAGDTTISKLTRTLGREVTEGAVLRAITELWQQLRIIPVVAAPGQAAQWQLLRQRFQKAIAEGASTSQVTAISVLASIYLQAVIAATMEEVELFLAPLTARSKVREVLRGLVATRQVHTIALGHAPHFYVAGTLPEFAITSNFYTSSSMPASAYFMHGEDREEELVDIAAAAASSAQVAPAPVATPKQQPVESHSPRTPAVHKPAASGKPSAARPHFSRPAAHSRDRKPAQTASGNRPVRRAGTESRPVGSRPASSRTASSARPTSSARWTAKPSSTSNGKRIDTRSSSASAGATRSSGNGRPAARPANATSSSRTAKSSAPAWSQRNGHKPTAKTGTPSRSSSPARGVRNDARPDSRSTARPVRAGASSRPTASRKPTLAAGAKASNAKRFGFIARPGKPKDQGTKKRG